MSAEDVESERIYTINLKKIFITPRWRRTVRAVNLIKEFARKHMKSSEVKLDESINLFIWMRGMESPP
ncbi:MAG: 50S ribosomal protein L31e, partial [Nitrososphaerales archaeon]